MTAPELLEKIRDFCAKQRPPLADSAFGRRYLSDPRFVADLAGGRKPRIDTIERVLSVLAKG